MDELVAQQTSLLKDGLVPLQQKYEAIQMLSKDIGSFMRSHSPAITNTSAILNAHVTELFKMDAPINMVLVIDELKICLEQCEDGSAVVSEYLYYQKAYTALYSKVSDKCQAVLSEILNEAN